MAWYAIMVIAMAMVVIMAKFLVLGEIKVKGKPKPFEKQVEAPSEKLAREKTYSLFGSNAGIKRSAIKISSVEKM